MAKASKTLTVVLKSRANFITGINLSYLFESVILEQFANYVNIDSHF